MNTLEKKVDLLAQILLADNRTDRTKAMSWLEAILKDESEHASASIEDAAESLLIEIGVPPSLRGFHDLKLAISMVAGNQDYNGRFVTGLYADIARRVGRESTVTKVERGMRHAIEVAWNRGDTDVFFKYFGNTIDPARGKPTNREFIVRMADEAVKRVG